MATRAVTTSGVPPAAMGDANFMGETAHHLWAGLLNGDDGTPVRFAEFADKSVQFDGTFGVGGSIQLEGSNDLTSPTNWFILNDVQTSPIVKTAAALEQVAEAVVWIRPRVTAGDGTTNLTCRVMCRKTRGRAF